MNQKALAMSKAPKIAIVGAGIAGVRLAQILSRVCTVSVFEKSRGVGGRMSTRRATDHAFDHGAQYFTARGESFGNFLQPFLANGMVARWSPKIVSITNGQTEPLEWTAPRYVAVPGMTALCKAMAAPLDLYSGHRVVGLERNEGQWSVILDSGDQAKGFDWVISTAPAEQSAVLLPQLTDWSQISMWGSYSLMLSFDRQVSLPFDAAVIRGSPLAWIADNASKPGRPGAGSILCQSDVLWSDHMMDADQTMVQTQLCGAFGNITGIDPSRAGYIGLHRWRYAKVRTPASTICLLDDATQSAAAGDWCGAGRIESAFDSAEALARMILDRLARCYTQRIVV